MKALLTLLAAVTIFAGYSQGIESFDKKLEPFNKIVVSHKIDLILIPGEEESIKIEYIGVDPENIIIDQRRGRVHVYLDHAKFFDLGERRPHGFDRRERYRDAHLRAYVTFKSLKLIETRGEGDVVCDGKIFSKKLKVRAYGETDIQLAHVDARTFKARLFGANNMSVLDGDASHLSYKMYGENRINSRGLSSITSNTTIYGEGYVRLHASEEVRLTSFGEPNLYVSGSPYISKGIILGHANIRRN